MAFKDQVFLTIYLTFILSNVLPLVYAQQPTAEPGPDADPLRPGIPSLYFSTAGVPPYKQMDIVPFNSLSVCPDDYDQGFSIGCRVTNPGTVFWRVNGSLYQKEYFAPYFVAGNTKKKIRPFTELDNAKGRIRVACRVLTRKSVWVDIIKSC